MEPVAKKQRISHYKKNLHHDTIDSLRMTNSYDNNRDGNSFIRSRDNDDYFGLVFHDFFKLFLSFFKKTKKEEATSS